MLSDMCITIIYSNGRRLWVISQVTQQLFNFDFGTAENKIANFYGSSFMSIRGGGLAKIMRDARHDHSSFLMAANMQYLQISGSMDTSKCTPDQPQHLCSSFIPSLHFCNTCLETRGLPAVAGVVSKSLWHWMNTHEMFLCI